MRISDWSSDVCSSDLRLVGHAPAQVANMQGEALGVARVLRQPVQPFYMHAAAPGAVDPPTLELNVKIPTCHTQVAGTEQAFVVAADPEEHTSELQSLMRISYAVFCLKKKQNSKH